MSDLAGEDFFLNYPVFVFLDNNNEKKMKGG